MGSIAYATPVSVLQGIENFLQDIALQMEGAPQLPAHTLGSSSQTKFYSPSRSFPFCTHHHPLHLVLFFRLASSLSHNQVFSEAISHSLGSRIPYPTSDNRQSTSSPQRAATYWNLAALISRIGGSQKEWRIQPCDLKFYCPPSFSALLPLIGRSREGPQRPPPSPIPGRKAATCDGPQVSMPSH